MHNFRVILPKITKRPEEIEVGKLIAKGHTTALQKAIEAWPGEVKGIVDVVRLGPRGAELDTKRFRVVWEGPRNDKRATYEAVA